MSVEMQAAQAVVRTREGDTAYFHPHADGLLVSLVGESIHSTSDGNENVVAILGPYDYERVLAYLVKDRVDKLASRWIAAGLPEAAHDLRDAFTTSL
jgi:hypothetical protein